MKTKLNFQGFHEEFKPFKKIGEGNFAKVHFIYSQNFKHIYKVYMARSNIDGRDYAIKALNKHHLCREKNGIVNTLIIFITLFTFNKIMYNNIFSIGFLAQ